MSLYSTLRAAPAAQATPAMVDMAFALAGERLPQAYAFPLEVALLEALPWLDEDEFSGVHAIRAPVTDYGIVLSHRSRLVLRVPAGRAEEARKLAGRRLEIGDARLDIGVPSLKPIEPFATLQAWNVATAAADEQLFLADIAFQLEVLGVRARLICGRPYSIGDGNRQVRGFGLVAHELSAAHSLLLQARGLGPARRLGCGIFVHHKIIEGLGDDPD